MDEETMLAATSMLSARYAAERPDAVAIHDAHDTTSFHALHDRANRLANVLHRHGLRAGDGLALVCGNRAEFVVTLLAALRSGLRLTPINHHLRAEEIEYIVADCEARALIVEAGFAVSGHADVPTFVIGDGFERELAAAAPTLDFAPTPGTIMLYTSGTTGKPKGVWKPHPEPTLPQYEGTFADYRPDRDVQLCAGPAYHAAPLLFDIRWPLASGVPIVMLQTFDAATVLTTIERHRITHAHLVPIMMRRLLDLPEPARNAADVASLRLVVHGAAPCPVDTKAAMIDWFGPILTEYYGASEQGSGIHITSTDWLDHPGSVGRRPDPNSVQIRDEHGQRLADGAEGTIWLRADPANRFAYFNDPGKTLGTFDGEYMTLGDIGRFDADGWLTLTGRSAECIISGGVNIYPREIDDALLTHPDVVDACTVGVPDPEWGEAVKAVVELRPGAAACAEALTAHVRARIAAFKVPRSVDFVERLPRSASGKIARHAVRALYWAAAGRQI